MEVYYGNRLRVSRIGCNCFLSGTGISYIPVGVWVHEMNMTIGTATIPDGYFGDTRDITLEFDAASGKTIIVSDVGWFNSGLPPAVDAAESAWLILNHPTARNYTGVKIG